MLGENGILTEYVELDGSRDELALTIEELNRLGRELPGRTDWRRREMTNRERRLRKLEATLTDSSSFVPHGSFGEPKRADQFPTK